MTPTVPTTRDRGAALQQLAALLPTFAALPDADTRLRGVAAGLIHPGHDTRLVPALLTCLGDALAARRAAREQLAADEVTGTPYFDEVRANATARHLVWALLEAPGLVPCHACLVERRPYADTHQGVQRADGLYRCAEHHGVDVAARHEIRVEAAPAVTPGQITAALGRGRLAGAR